jgi:hypothetical protein
MYAILGCDTTSDLYGIGKEAALKKFVIFLDQDKAFDAASASIADVVAARENALVCLTVCTMGSQGRDSIHYDTSVIVRRWLLALLMYNHNAYHILQGTPATRLGMERE